jgi:hypothetical protein
MAEGKLSKTKTQRRWAARTETHTMLILKIFQNFINYFINLICWRRGVNRDDSILFMTTRRIGRDDDPPTSWTGPIFDIHPLLDELKDRYGEPERGGVNGSR